MKMAHIRNFLILVGIFYLSWWVMSPVFIIYPRLTEGITYGGGILGQLLMGIVAAVPVALAAFSGGIAAAYIVDAVHIKYWLVLLAILYAVNSFSGFHYWATEPQLSDRVFQLTLAIFPAIACYLGGLMIKKAKDKREMRTT